MFFNSFSTYLHYGKINIIFKVIDPPSKLTVRNRFSLLSHCRLRRSSVFVRAARFSKHQWDQCSQSSQHSSIRSHKNWLDWPSLRVWDRRGAFHLFLPFRMWYSTRKPLRIKKTMLNFSNSFYVRFRLTCLDSLRVVRTNTHEGETRVPTRLLCYSCSKRNTNSKRPHAIGLIWEIKQKCIKCNLPNSHWCSPGHFVSARTDAFVAWLGQRDVFHFFVLGFVFFHQVLGYVRQAFHGLQLKNFSFQIFTRKFCLIWNKF